MAVQRFTIAKIVGPSATDTIRRFQRWAAARTSDDPSSYSTDEWPAATRRQMDRWIAALEANAHAAPVVYWSSHVDHWSAGWLANSQLGGRGIYNMGNAGELWCYALPDRGRLARRAKSQSVKGQYDENRWFAARIGEAIEAYSNLRGPAVLVVIRRAYDASPTDEEMAAAATRRPAWLRERN